MEVLILGAGKVGYFLAKSLSKNHNVTIIDKNEKAIEKINENLDVLTIKKDIRDPSVFYILNDEYDFFLSVTNNDEINIIAPMLLKEKINIKKTIIRLSNNFYVNSPLYKLTDSRLIFPYILCASAVAFLMEFPKANNIKKFPFTEFSLVSIRVKKPYVTQINEIEKINVKVIGVERNEKFIFLNSNDDILEDDLIYIFGDLEEIKKIASKLDTLTPSKIEKVTIFSADTLGITIANILYEMGLKIKIIEKDEQKALKAAEELPDEIEILNLAYEDDELFYTHGINLSDVAITAYLHDEENIIKSLKAQKIGIKKVITVNNNLNYHSIMHSLKLSTIRGPKIAAFYEILEDIDSQHLIYERFFLGSKGKIFIKKIFKPVKITPPKEYAKILVVRDNEIFVIKDEFLTKENDLVIEFNFSGNKTWIESL
jgi:trk system potassium uptake protein TrkA